MQRTNAVMRKIDEIVKAEPGVHYVNAVSGYSLLSQTASPRNGLYFVQLAPYEERATRALQSDAIVASLNRKLYGLPEAQVFAFLPPAIPGVGQAGGVDVFIQDRAGKTRRLPLAEHAAVHGRAAEAARDRVPRDDVRARRAAALRARRRGPGVQARRPDPGRVHDAPGVPRRRLREPVQPLRARLARLPPGRAAVPDGSGRSRACSTCETSAATRSRCRRSSRSRSRRAPSTRTASTSIARSRSWRCRRRATARVRRWPPSPPSPIRSCRATWATRGTA